MLKRHVAILVHCKSLWILGIPDQIFIEQSRPMITSRTSDYVQLAVSLCVRWMFDVDQVIVETHIVLLTATRSYCSELRNLRQTSTLVPST